MKLSGEAQAELIKIAAVVVVAALVIYAAGKAAASAKAAVFDLADWLGSVPGKTLVYVRHAVGADGIEYPAEWRYVDADQVWEDSPP